jgi:hypothetical protein
MAAPRSEEEASPQVERLWPGRLRWRLRGAWQWPAFLVLTVVDGALLELLPPYGDGPGGLLPGILLAGFANLLLVAVGGPLVGRFLLRRRRPDLPKPIADDYAGTALMCGLLVFLVLAGLAHRPAVAAGDRDRRAVFAAVHDFVRVHAPGYAGVLSAGDALRLDEHYYRACLPSGDVRRALCVFVDTSAQPARVREDTDRTPNRDWRRFP